MKEILELFEKKRIRDEDKFCVSKEVGEFLRFLVFLKRPRNILEIGTWEGCSALWMGKAAASYGGKITTIEITPEKVLLAEKNIIESGLNDTILVLNGEALKTIPKLKGMFDFVFIDAMKKEYIEYFNLLNSKLEKGAVIVADNITSHPEKVKPYVDYLKRLEKDGIVKNVFVNIGSGLLLTLVTI